MPYRPIEVAQSLGISSSTLRLWSNQFASLLSEQARKEPSGSGSAPAQRRYTDDDLRLLTLAKELLDQGLTYEDTRTRLQPPAAPALTHGATPPPQAGTTSTQGEADLTRALQEALQVKDRTIAALQESLAFMDVYLQTVLQEREDARARERLLQQQLQQIQFEPDVDAPDQTRPWWKRLLAMP